MALAQKQRSGREIQAPARGCDGEQRIQIGLARLRQPHYFLVHHLLARQLDLA
jgi:hypothetical protein